MSFWEIVKQVFAAMGEAIARWFTVAWKTRPLSAAIKNEQKLMRKRFVQLGERYYDKCAEGIIDDGALAYLVRDVSTSRARITEYMSEIAVLRQKPSAPLTAPPAETTPEPAPAEAETAAAEDGSISTEA